MVRGLLRLLSRIYQLWYSARGLRARWQPARDPLDQFDTNYPFF
jgi:hypothetical protein